MARVEASDAGIPNTKKIWADDVFVAYQNIDLRAIYVLKPLSRYVY